MSGTLAGGLMNSSGIPRTGAEDWSRSSVVSFGAEDRTRYCWFLELVSVPLMLSVAGSQLHLPVRPLTASGA